MQHYLDETTILVTTDRPSHNTVLARGLRSYYLDSEGLTDQPLPGIQPKPELTPAKNDLILKDSYEQPALKLRPLLLPTSPRRLKKLRVKRRRIRNHFQGQDHLDQAAVTVSWLGQGDQTLIGIRVCTTFNVGLKALDASESYLLEAIAPSQRGLVSICHALVLLIQLVLQPVKTVVYCDAQQIGDPLAPKSPGRNQTFFASLLDCFAQLKFVPVTQNQHLAKLQRKLNQLVRHDRAGEIVTGDILNLIDKVIGTRL